MNQEDKIYINQIWHKIELEEKRLDVKSKLSLKHTFIKGVCLISSTLLFLISLFNPLLLKGGSTFIGLIILSITTYTEYKKLIGGTYEF